MARWILTAFQSNLHQICGETTSTSGIASSIIRSVCRSVGSANDDDAIVIGFVIQQIKSFIYRQYLEFAISNRRFLLSLKSLATLAI